MTDIALKVMAIAMHHQNYNLRFGGSGTGHSGYMCAKAWPSRAAEPRPIKPARPPTTPYNY